MKEKVKEEGSKIQESSSSLPRYYLFLLLLLFIFNT